MELLQHHSSTEERYSTLQIVATEIPGIVKHPSELAADSVALTESIHDTKREQNGASQNFKPCGISGLA